MLDKEKRPAEMETPTGTVTMTFPDYNMFSGEEQEKALEIMELFWMALQVNGLEERITEKTESLPTVSLHFSGITARFSVDCYKSGYDKKTKPECMEVYTDAFFTDTFFFKCDCITEYLHGILKGMKHDA